MPIPLAANRHEHSLINIVKPYIAISYDKLFYVSLTESEYQFCTGNQLKRCNQALSMQETSHPDCALALFNDNANQISKLCKISLLPATNFNTSHIISVSDNSYLISTQDLHWIQTCPGRAPVHVPSCKLCVVKLPCSCALKGQTFFIPPTLQNCLPNHKPIVTHSLFGRPATFLQ